MNGESSPQFPITSPLKPLAHMELYIMRIIVGLDLSFMGVNVEFQRLRLRHLDSTGVRIVLKGNRN